MRSFSAVSQLPSLLDSQSCNSELSWSSELGLPRASHADHVQSVSAARIQQKIPQVRLPLQQAAARLWSPSRL